MTTFIPTLIFCLGLIIGAIYTYRYAGLLNADTEGKTMKKFEYYTIYGKHGDEINRMLDRYGAEGWEAFAVVPYETGVVIYFKREKR